MTVDDLVSDSVLPLNPALGVWLAERLAAADGEPDTFLVLSDEEIIALEGGVDPEYTIAPVLDQLGEIAPKDLVTIGTRSLLLRGLMSATDGGPPELIELAEMALAGRTTGTAMLRLVSTHGGSRTGCVAMIQPDGAVVEDATIGGFHLFTACTQTAAIKTLTRWALPVEWPPGAPAQELVDSDRLDTWLMNELGMHARVVQAELHWRSAAHQMTSAVWLIAHNDQYGVFVDLGSEQGGKVMAYGVDRSRLLGRFTDIIARIHVPVPGDSRKATS